jgi:hypothetical protein
MKILTAFHILLLNTDHEFMKIIGTRIYQKLVEKKTQKISSRQKYFKILHSHDLRSLPNNAQITKFFNSNPLTSNKNL